MKLLDLFDFCTKLHFCIFHHFFANVIRLRIEVCKFCTKVDIFLLLYKTAVLPFFLLHSLVSEKYEGGSLKVQVQKWWQSEAL